MIFSSKGDAIAIVCGFFGGIGVMIYFVTGISVFRWTGVALCIIAMIVVMAKGIQSGEWGGKSRGVSGSDYDGSDSDGGGWDLDV